MSQELTYPRYEVHVDGVRQWLDRPGTVQAFASLHHQVELGPDVIESYGALPRRLTPEEQTTIRNAADQLDAAK